MNNLEDITIILGLVAFFIAWIAFIIFERQSNKLTKELDDQLHQLYRVKGQLEMITELRREAENRRYNFGAIKYPATWFWD